MFTRKQFKESALLSSLSILPKNDRRKIPIVILSQVILGFLDLIGVALFGIVGALAVTGVSSGVPGERVTKILSLLHLTELSFQSQVLILGVLAATLLVTKTIISALIVRKATYYFANRGAALTVELTRRLFYSNVEKVKSRSPQENLFALTNGVTAICVGILPITMSFFADVSLLIILVAGLIAVDFLTASATILLFSLTAFVLYKMMHLEASKLGEENAILTIQNNQTILEGLSSFREILVKNRRLHYVEKVSKQRTSIANASAGLANMPNLSKYVIEITVVIGAVFISAIQFLTQDAIHAVAVLSIFMAASTRIAPAVLRIQQGAIQLRGHTGSAKPSLALIKSLSEKEIVSSESKPIKFVYPDFVPEIKLDNVSFGYHGSTKKVLSNIDIHIKPGEFCAIVGPSGAGKSTLIDVILGILEISEGELVISNLAPERAMSKWPGAISYLPQDIVLSPGTIRTNIALGFDENEINDSEIDRSAQIAQLEEFVDKLADGLDSSVEERGENFSGGQRQRIGIARALYTNPKLLILDEATSALDGDTEATFTRTLRALKGDTTILMVAHRLSTIMDADCVYYMDSGRVLGKGKFDELKQIVPDFARQAALMGL